MTNPPDPKKERLAAALRANLRRRKAQEREQTSCEQATAPANGAKSEES